MRCGTSEMTVSRASSGSNPWRVLPTGCGRCWAEYELHEHKTTAYWGTILLLQARHSALSSHDPEERNEIFRSPSRGSRPTFPVVYFAMIIRAFLAPEPRGTERMRRGHALPAGSVTLADQTHYFHFTLDYPPFHHFPSTYLPPSPPPVPPWLLLDPEPQSPLRFSKGLALSTH